MPKSFYVGTGVRFCSWIGHTDAERKRALWPESSIGRQDKEQERLVGDRHKDRLETNFHFRKV